LAPDWGFRVREKQTGCDPVNALLDLGYTLLRHAVAGLIQARGLTPWLGHLHAVQAGHMALASDLMEEFRPVVVDAVVLNLCLNQRLRPGDFVVQAGGAHVLKPAMVKLFIREIETRMNTEIRSMAGGGEVQDIRRLIDGQVRRLTLAYRAADPALYQPCVMK
jgi:CRISPR-associated protein Cas1